MGFSRDKIRSEAKRQYRGLEIDDVPGGVVTLRSPLRLSDAEQAQATEIERRLESMQGDKNATMADVRACLIDLAVVLADRKDGFAEYLAEFDTAELLALYSLWSRETQAGESKSGK